MQGCDSERVTEESERNGIRMDLNFTEHDNSKGTSCQGVFTLQVIRMACALCSSHKSRWKCGAEEVRNVANALEDVDPSRLLSKVDDAAAE